MLLDVIGRYQFYQVSKFLSFRDLVRCVSISVEVLLFGRRDTLRPPFSDSNFFFSFFFFLSVVPDTNLFVSNVRRQGRDGFRF